MVNKIYKPSDEIRKIDFSNLSGKKVKCKINKFSDDKESVYIIAELDFNIVPSINTLYGWVDKFYPEETKEIELTIKDVW